MTEVEQKQGLDDSKSNTAESEAVEQPSADDAVAVASPELLVKHPLEHKWALWYFKNDRTKDWSENLKQVSTFAFVEDFWALYNYIQPASKLGNGCDYSVFKDGIQPAWEDERNKKGGRWMISVNKNQRFEELDKFWLDILLCLIGEAFGDHSDEICGAVVNIRAKGDKVGVWTASAEKESTMYIGKTLKERLCIPPKIMLGYQLHDDSMSKTGSMTRNKYQI